MGEGNCNIQFRTRTFVSLCFANIFLEGSVSGHKGDCGLDPWDMQDASVWNFGT